MLAFSYTIEKSMGRRRLLYYPESNVGCSKHGISQSEETLRLFQRMPMSP